MLAKAEDACRTMVLARHHLQLDAAASNGECPEGSGPDARGALIPRLRSPPRESTAPNPTPAEHGGLDIFIRRIRLYSVAYSLLIPVRRQAFVST